MAKCQNCGLLYFIGNAHEGYQEASNVSRKRGSSEYNPRCLSLSHLVDVEAQQDYDARLRSGEIPSIELARRISLEVISLERDCKKFCEWKPRLSPIEHTRIVHEREIREEAAQQQKAMTEWQAEQRKLDAERQSKQRKEDQERQAAQRKEDLDRQERNRLTDYRQRWWLAIMSAGTAIVTGAGGFFLGRFFEKKQEPPVVNIIAPSAPEK